MYRIEEILKLEQAHLENWQKLWDSTMESHFFNSPSWFKTYLKTFNVQNYRVFFCYQNSQLVGVLPLIFTKKFGIKTLASVDKMYDFLDRSTILLADKEQRLIEQILNTIKDKYNIYLAELEERDVKFFENIRMNVLTEFSANCPRMAIGEDILTNVSKKQKKSLKKKLRNNEKYLSFKMFRTDLGQHLETMFALERKSHKKRKGISIFEKQYMRKLYRSLVKNGNDFVGISFLYYRGKPIAHRFGFFYHDTFMSIHVAFDDKYRTLGPGKLLLFYCLKYFQKNGIRTLDFSVGESYLKKQFADGKTVQHNIYFSKSKGVMTWWSILIKAKSKAKCIKNITQECVAQGTMI